jgi:hypothetical protein
MAVTWGTKVKKILAMASADGQATDDPAYGEKWGISRFA